VVRLPVISQNHSSLRAADPFSTLPIPRAGLGSRGLGYIEKTVAPMGARRLRVPEGATGTQDLGNIDARTSLIFGFLHAP
jgi:hypothetical protein